MRLFLTTLLLSTILLAKCNEVKLATLAARITKTGFDYVSRFGHKIIDFEIPRIEWPEIDIPIDVGPGSGRVVVSDLYIPQFQTPNFTFFLEPPKSVHWISKDGLINLKGKINVKYTLLVPIYFSGTVYVTAANIKTNYSISMHDSEGRPQIDINYCQTDIETLKISIEGGIVPWLLNLFKNQLDILFKKLLKTQFCDALKTTLINELNVILIQLPTHIDVGSNFYINYNYNSSPIVTSTYVQLETYADAIIGNKTCGIYVKPMNTIDAPEGFMGNIWISSALPNCFLKSAHESNLLRLVVNKNMSSQLESFLRTSCKFIDICIGKFFSKLKKEYPDQYLDVAVRSEERPRFLMSDDGVSVLGLFDLDFVIAPYTEKSEILARLALAANASIIPLIANRRISGNFSYFNMTLNQEFSSIGNFSPTLLNIIKSILEPVIRAIVQTTASVGFPIPIIHNLTLSNDTQIITIKDASRVDFNLKFINHYMRKLFKGYLLRKKNTKISTHLKI